MARTMKVAGVIALALLVGLVGSRVLRQRRGPAGSSNPIPPPTFEALGRNTITVTCGPEIVSAGGDVFGSALYMPRWIGTAHDSVNWERGFLTDTADALAAHIKGVGAPVYLRFGHQPTDGFLLPGGSYSTGYFWREALSAAAGQMSVDEYMAYVRRVGAEPQIVVNFGTDSAASAGDLVAYLNGTDPSDPMVALRASRGHPDPYRVRVFELGNEQYGHWEAGNASYPGGGPGSSNTAAYVARLNQFADAMRPRSPLPLTLYAPLAYWELNVFDEATISRIVSGTAASLDGYAIHYYPAPIADAPWPPSEVIKPDRWAGLPYLFGEKLKRARELIDEASGGKHLDIAITEWAGSAYPTAMGRNFLSGLLAADSLMVMASNGVSVSNYFAAASAPGDAGGYSYWLDGNPARPAPTLVATEETARHLGRELLGTDITGVPAGRSETEVSGEFRFPTIAATCSKGEGARYLALVNRSARQERVGVDLNFEVAGQIRSTLLLAPPLSEAIDVAESRWESSTRFITDVPPLSVLFLTFPSHP